MNTQETPMTNPHSVDEGKVDVLAVLDKHIKAKRALGYEASAREGEKARAAVAELIVTSRDAVTVLQDKAGPGAQETPRRLWEALARIGATT